MLPFVQTNVFDADAIKAWGRATGFVQKVPQVDPQGRDIRCHELVRGLQPLLGPEWMVIDGFNHTTDHTWLFRTQGTVILDVYAVARLPAVQLVDAGYLPYRLSPLAAAPHLTANPQYQEGRPRDDIREDVVSWITALLTPKPRVKCPTCRCHIEVGSECACCIGYVDTDDDEPFV